MDTTGGLYSVIVDKGCTCSVQPRWKVIRCWLRSSNKLVHRWFSHDQRWPAMVYQGSKQIKQWIIGDGFLRFPEDCSSLASISESGPDASGFSHISPTTCHQLIVVVINGGKTPWNVVSDNNNTSYQVSESSTTMIEHLWLMTGWYICLKRWDLSSAVG